MDKRFAVLTLCFLAACGGATSETDSVAPSSVDATDPDPLDPGGKGDSPVDMRSLKIEHADGKIPIREVSGLALREVDGKRELLAVGDSDFVLARASFSSKSHPEAVSFVRHDLAKLFPSQQASQWEAIACDPAGRVFLLNENPGIVHVVSSGLDAIVHRFELRVDSDGPTWKRELAKQWEGESNSRGEGMALGRNGHLFILKEKKDPSIIEFGPAGDSPVGFAQPLATAFALPQGKNSTLVPLRLWNFAKSARDVLPDMSDLFVDAKGKLYIVSGDGRAIGRVKESLDPSDSGKLHFSAAWKLPKSISNPEGLVVADDQRPWVATDDSDNENLFQLEHLSP